jgi:myb proto-oncogene protein
LDPSIDRANERTGKWTEDENSKLKDAVETHGDKNWGAIAALVPGRVERQCHNRWRAVLDPSIDRATMRKRAWTKDEDSKLKDSVQTYCGEDWAAISALVPGRTKSQCRNRWKDVLDPIIDRAGRRIQWTVVEDSKLRESVQMHGGKNWERIAALVPGRTQKLCCTRWHNILKNNIDPSTARAGK